MGILASTEGAGGEGCLMGGESFPYPASMLNGENVARYNKTLLINQSKIRGFSFIGKSSFYSQNVINSCSSINYFYFCEIHDQIEVSSKLNLFY